MEYAHYDPLPLETFFPSGHPGHPNPMTMPVAQSQGLFLADGQPFGTAFEQFDDRQGYPGYGATSGEGGVDTAKGPRLTQEQLVRLEEEFSQQYKPSTEYKRALAENMGVEYPKVNNWFQNRRAKAKQDKQAQKRSDGSLHESALPFAPTPLDYRRTSDSQLSPHFSSPTQMPAMIDPLGPQAEFDYLNDIPHYHAHQQAMHDQNYDPSSLQQLDFQAVSADSLPLWPAQQIYDDHKPAEVSVREIPSQESFSAPASVPSSFIDAGRGSVEWHAPPLYSNVAGGNFVGNPSIQSFGTCPSEEGEQAKYVTPPLEASPLPGTNQGTFQHDRHSSNSSELAENLGTVHIQPPQADPSINCTHDTAPASNSNDTTTGLLTPDVSPNTAVPKMPFAMGHDLASRRKRPRPAALQPDANRSASYAGPLTTSPRLRVSPPGSGKMSPVRRIRSTGNNLNVMHGRIKKSSTAAPQKSPRNLESCFKVATMPEPRHNTERDNNTTQTSDTDGSSMMVPPLPPNRQGTWPSFPHDTLPSTTWDQGANDSVSHNQSLTQPEWVSGHHNHMNLSLAIPPPQSVHPQQYMHHFPPQSAPSHVTSFDSATALVSEHPDARWTLSSVQHEPYRDDTHLSMPIRPNHLAHHSHSGPFNHYQGSMAPFPVYGPSMGVFMPCAPFLQRSPTPPFKSLDIKVETGPPPPKEMAQISQERKEYTFENSFSNDVHFTTGSKK